MYHVLAPGPVAPARARAARRPLAEPARRHAPGRLAVTRARRGTRWPRCWSARLFLLLRDATGRAGPGGRDRRPGRRWCRRSSSTSSSSTRRCWARWSSPSPCAALLFRAGGAPPDALGARARCWPRCRGCTRSSCPCGACSRLWAVRASSSAELAPLRARPRRSSLPQAVVAVPVRALQLRDHRQRAAGRAVPGLGPGRRERRAGRAGPARPRSSTRATGIVPYVPVPPARRRRLRPARSGRGCAPRCPPMARLLPDRRRRRQLERRRLQPRPLLHARGPVRRSPWPRVALARADARPGVRAVALALAGWTAVIARLLWHDPHAANDCALLLARSAFADGNVYVPNLFLRAWADAAPGPVGARRWPGSRSRRCSAWWTAARRSRPRRDVAARALSAGGPCSSSRSPSASSAGRRARRAAPAFPDAVEVRPRRDRVHRRPRRLTRARRASRWRSVRMPRAPARRRGAHPGRAAVRRLGPGGAEADVARRYRRAPQRPPRRGGMAVPRSAIVTEGDGRARRSSPRSGRSGGSARRRTTAGRTTTRPQRHDPEQPRAVLLLLQARAARRPRPSPRARSRAARRGRGTSR